VQVGVGAEARGAGGHGGGLDAAHFSYDAEMEAVELSVELFDERETADGDMRRAIRAAVIDDMPAGCRGVIVLQRLRVDAASAAPALLHAAPCAFVSAQLLRGGDDSAGPSGAHRPSFLILPHRERFGVAVVAERTNGLLRLGTALGRNLEIGN
jgi:hypothetical protein